MTSKESRTTTGCGRSYGSVVDTIGNTPCIRVNNLAPDHVRLYVKAEFFNPAGSVKDRLAISIIEEAERKFGGRDRVMTTWPWHRRRAVERCTMSVGTSKARYGVAWCSWQRASTSTAGSTMESCCTRTPRTETTV